MTLATRIIGTQQLQAGDTVGYGSRFTAEGPLTIGVAACGYADGYPRHCDTGTPVLVNGVRTRLVGRVSMDMVTVDLSPVIAAGMDAGFGSEVTLWGAAPAPWATSWRAVLWPIDEVASPRSASASNHRPGTVGYELMCAAGAMRVPAVDSLALRYLATWPAVRPTPLAARTKALWWWCRWWQFSSSGPH
jgi:alanine racemase